MISAKVDYGVYTLQRNERLIGNLMGAVSCFIVSYIFFHNLICSYLFSILGSGLALPLYKQFLLEKRKRYLLVQFSGLLDSLAHSYTVGSNTQNAFISAYNDMCQQYSRDSMIAKELSIILAGLKNNFTMNELLFDFANRSHLEDIANFAEIFTICNRLGGNMKEVVCETKELIQSKIAIVMDIETTIIEKKNELKLLLIMPMIVIGMLSLLGNEEINNNSWSNILVKVVAIMIFSISYLIGKKITNIKI